MGNLKFLLVVLLIHVTLEVLPVPVNQAALYRLMGLVDLVDLEVLEDHLILFLLSCLPDQVFPEHLLDLGDRVFQDHQGHL